MMMYGDISVRPKAAVAAKRRNSSAQGNALGWLRTTTKVALKGRDHHRSGYTLVEMLVVISVNSVLLAAAVTLLAALVKSDRGGQQHFERTRSLVQLAEQFRDDVAAARNATITADQAGETLRLRFGDDRTVDYARDGDRIRRLDQEGSVVSSREAYSLAQLSNATFGVSEGKLTTLNLSFSEGANTCRIDARLARDRRFAGGENRP